MIEATEAEPELLRIKSLSRCFAQQEPRPHGRPAHHVRVELATPHSSVSSNGRPRRRRR